MSNKYDYLKTLKANLNKPNNGAEEKVDGAKTADTKALAKSLGLETPDESGDIFPATTWIKYQDFTKEQGLMSAVNFLVEQLNTNYSYGWSYTEREAICGHIISSLSEGYDIQTSVADMFELLGYSQPAEMKSTKEDVKKFADALDIVKAKHSARGSFVPPKLKTNKAKSFGPAQDAQDAIAWTELVKTHSSLA